MHRSVFLYPLLLSLLSGVIFWFFMEYIPKYVKLSRIKPIFYEDFSNLESQLFSVFDIIMKPSENTVSDYQEIIRGGKLTKEDIKIGLANKCYNESYLYDQTIARILIVVGSQLYQKFNEISSLVEKIYINRNLLTASNEILLNDIKRQISIYYPDKTKLSSNAISKVNGMEFKPLVTSMIADTENFNDLYQLYKKVRDYIFIESTSNQRNYLLHKIQYLVNNEQYKKALRIINYTKRKYEKDLNLLELYEVYCLYNVVNFSTFHKKLDSYLSKRYYNGSLVSSRSILKYFLSNDSVIKTIKNYYSEEEISELVNTLAVEEKNQQLFVQTNHQLIDYFTSLDQRLRLI